MIICNRKQGHYSDRRICDKQIKLMSLRSPRGTTLRRCLQSVSKYYSSNYQSQAWVSSGHLNKSINSITVHTKTYTCSDITIINAGADLFAKYKLLGPRMKCGCPIVITLSVCPSVRLSVRQHFCLDALTEVVMR